MAEEDNASHVAVVDDREDSAVRNHMADDTLHGDDDDEVVHVLLLVVDDRIHEHDVEEVAPPDDDDWRRQHSSLMVCSPMVLPPLLNDDDVSCWPTYHSCCRQDDSCHLLQWLDDEKSHHSLTAVPLTGARSVALTLLLLSIYPCY